ncbi:molybdenum cofactor guanylyltransferase [Aureimonas flava]|uniref:Molybdenum cofactor guanylyltransferase n=1 Tax=Aureimonas flava TaxID=2320271 RepID=A0A3A1WLS7_9HYPH|nr:molybdenum cofactor guanylyltransferase [Aureimonas flava]RIY01821.1 molybdenum cofactor guanylyltransferase [Aureimonas flava]
MSETRPLPFGLILAGGRSSRMGLDRPKPLLDIAGRSMVGRVSDRLRPFVAQLLIATDRPELYADLGALAIPDEVPGYAGPLAGLQAGARHALRAGVRGAGLVSAPADTPFLPMDLVPRLLDGSGEDELRVAACSDRLHPTCAFWPATALRRLDALPLDAAQAPSLLRVMREHGFTTVPFPPADTGPGADPFFNVNTPAELETARAFAVSRG